jgi:hypothetical protein
MKECHEEKMPEQRGNTEIISASGGRKTAGQSAGCGKYGAFFQQSYAVIRK